MTPDFDVIIIGSGPAGVSAAFPLVESGLDVLMIDGGQEATITPPKQPFLLSREKDIDQWRWMVGESFYALQMREAVSPKLRVPTHDYVLINFLMQTRSQQKIILRSVHLLLVACPTLGDAVLQSFQKLNYQRSHVIQ